MRRFYSDVAASSDGAIMLDTRPVRTPLRASLIVPHPRLANAIVGEWSAQGERIDPRSMPMTGLANAVIDHIAPDPAPHIATLAAYANADCLCYRADAEQSDLATEQALRWNPILHWGETAFGIEFALASGVIPIDQPPATIAALRAALDGLDPWRLAAMVPIITIGGSIVAAFAVLNRAFDADALWDALILDEIWQEQQWGAVDDAEELRAAHKADWDAAIRFLGLIDDSAGHA